MEQDHTDNNLIIERYLRDELSPEEVAAFEESFLGSGELLDQLESAEKLSKGLQDIAALEKSRRQTTGPRWMPSIFQSPHYAMAASFLLVVTLGTSGVLYQRLSDLDASSNVATALPAQIVPLVSVRGGPSDRPINTITLDPDTSVFVLMLDPGYEPYSHFRATVQTRGIESAHRTILQADHLTPSYEDMLALSVPASLLTPGDFEIHVEGWREGWSPDHDFVSINVLSLRVLGSD